MRRTRLFEDMVAHDMQKSEAGLTIIEMMVASVLFAVGMLGLMSAVSSSMVVDTVAKENSIALNGAREVMERAKSEGFQVLVQKSSPSAEYAAARAAPAEPEPEPEPDPDGTTITTPPGQSKEKNPKTGTQSGAATSDETLSSEAAGDETDPITIGGGDTEQYEELATWFGAVAGLGQECLHVDSDGNFDIPGLDPCDDDPDGKVGKVGVTQIAADRLEITVTVRWDGRHGKTEKHLRCRVPDWRRFDAQ